MSMSLSMNMLKMLNLVVNRLTFMMSHRCVCISIKSDSGPYRFSTIESKNTAQITALHNLKLTQLLATHRFIQFLFFFAIRVIDFM